MQIKHLKFYNGNLLDLGQAEQFVMHLADLPDYHTLLMGHLRRAEFSVTLPQVSSLLASMMETSRIILNSEGLKEVLVLILRIGNFLNHVSAVVACSCCDITELNYNFLCFCCF